MWGGVGGYEKLYCPASPKLLLGLDSELEKVLTFWKATVLPRFFRLWLDLGLGSDNMVELHIKITKDNFTEVLTVSKDKH